MQTDNLPSTEYLHECFEYKDDGTLVWKARPRNHFTSNFAHNCSLSAATGKQVGTMGPEGYLVVKMNIYRHTQFALHRIIWKMHNGLIPEHYLIDHKDTIRTNNKILNLRITLPPGNSYNKSISSNNTSGVKGVSWDKKRCSWCARISTNCERLYVGHFKTLEDAKTAIETVRSLLHGNFTNHGKSY